MNITSFKSITVTSVIVSYLSTNLGVLSMLARKYFDFNEVMRFHRD